MAANAKAWQAAAADENNRQLAASGALAANAAARVSMGFSDQMHRVKSDLWFSLAVKRSVKNRAAFRRSSARGAVARRYRNTLLSIVATWRAWKTQIGI